ncbi:transcriptional regulator, TetR family [Gottschalkia purinilytica]|uniref:Transcriptional regulator, TetR family n=1 Tax=Gottschalkia purinilytica TaxID=1503 RepID=A0A0L0W6F6_GOTPU|nr:TetR/AcrR family transcriptional regulator [Gottschalkia purinilytica]KNF07062.1 transcriptional regulator, TetR family [Gottschalkia purinilytica]
MSTIENIKSTALKLFASNGYDGTSLENIAKEVGIRKSSIYYHFKSKEDLFFSVFEDTLNLDVYYIEKLKENFSELDVKEKLYSVFKYYYEIYNSESIKNETLFLKRIMLFPPLELKEKLQKRFEDYEKKLNKELILIFEEGFETKTIKKMETKDLLATFYCIIDGLLVEAHYYARQEYITRLDSIWKLFWSAIEV